jgi:hypothetical protein
MAEKANTLSRIVARVRAIPAVDWVGSAGTRFRRTVADFCRLSLRPGERIEAAPDLAWKAAEGLAHEKRAKALKDYAEVAKDEAETELARKTLESKSRQESALADKMESEARVAQVKEMEARLDLVAKLRVVGAIPIWDKKGKMTIVKAPPDFDWSALESGIIFSHEFEAFIEASETAPPE